MNEQHETQNDEIRTDLRAGDDGGGGLGSGSVVTPGGGGLGSGNAAPGGGAAGSGN